MKRAVLSAVLTAGLAAGTLPIFAQTATDQQSQNTQQQGAKEGHWRHKRGDHMEKMAQKLNLTQQQQDQLKPIMEKGREQAKAIWQDNSLSKDQKREKLQALHQQTQAEVNGILTPQQQQQMASLREERMNGRHEQFGQHMAQKLNLTQQQQDQLKPMFEKQREQAMAIRQDNSLTSEQKKEKMQALRQQTQSQMNQVLTPEQQQQLQQMRENRKQHRNHGGGGDQQQGQQQGQQPQGA